MLIGRLAIGGCLYLLASLPEKTLVRFVLWNLFGIGVYLAYGRWRSLQRLAARVTSQRG